MNNNVIINEGKRNPAYIRRNVWKRECENAVNIYFERMKMFKR